jgi:hypothetical protein
MRQRLTLLWTCAIRRRREVSAGCAACCSHVNSWSRGVLVGMPLATWDSVNARKPRSCHNRPQDQGLWRFNTPGVLRYLVLDELHTYDGAQGADVACLIRRLKERLGIARGEFCVVGTSATLDDREPPRDGASGTTDGAVDARETGTDRLARFASTLFAEDIQAEAVIGEVRLTVEEIVVANPQEVTLPDPAACVPLAEEDALQYAQRQSTLWGGPVYHAPAGTAAQIDAAIEQWPIQLGCRFMSHYILFTHERSSTHTRSLV